MVSSGSDSMRPLIEHALGEHAARGVVRAKDENVKCHAIDQRLYFDYCRNTVTRMQAE
jgi:hypothetical protein